MSKEAVCAPASCPVAGIMSFVLRLEKGHYLHQFGQFACIWALCQPFLCCAGIMNFVLCLEKGHYLYQFGQFAWTHMILLVVFIPTSFFVSNIFDGLIWFLLPCALVIINDISAYLTGALPKHMHCAGNACMTSYRCTVLAMPV